MTKQRSFLKNTQSKAVLILLLVVLASLLIFSAVSRSNNEFLSINDTELTYELVHTDEDRRLGLSHRESLDENNAMLFKFNNVGDHGIWMKDMKFNLDIIWLDADKRIVHIEENVAPETYPKSFRSPTHSLYVIEVNAGTVASHNFTIGDSVDF